MILCYVIVLFVSIALEELSHISGHVATNESFFTNTINSFIHERGCTVAGLLFIVCLLECEPVRPLWPQKQWMAEITKSNKFPNSGIHFELLIININY